MAGENQDRTARRDVDSAR